MKKHFAFAFLLFSISACADKSETASNTETPLTKEQLANRNIQQHLNTLLNDTASYESVSFDSLRVITRKDSLLLALQPLKERQEVVSDLLNIQARKPGKDFNETAKHAEQIQHQMDSILTEAGKPENQNKTVGFHKIHAYRSKNEGGALVLKKMEFVLDTALNVVKANPLN